MDQSDYAKQWQELFTEKSLLLDRRTNLETELADLNTQLRHLSEVLNHLAPLAGVSVGDDISDLGITDAIRYVLQHSATAMSANDVRNALTTRGYDLSGHSAPMSSIYKILGRLANDDTSKIVREEGDGGRVYYRHTEPDVITDDDIPF